MLMDINAPLYDMDGKPLVQPQAGGGMTLASVAIEAVMGSLPGDEKATGEDKARSFELAARLAAARRAPGRSIEVTVDDAALIKKRIGIAYGPLVVGQCWPMLESKPNPLAPPLVAPPLAAE